MALDACVYCDCLEKGLVVGLEPGAFKIVTEADGYPNLYKNGEPIEDDHQDYHLYECAHAYRFLAKHHLGNISLVSLLRFELKREPSQFPILLEKVIHNGTHAGDWLSVETVKAMQIELERLQTFQAKGTKAMANPISALLQDWRLLKGIYISAKDSALFIANFREQMLELSAASLSIGKPIVF